MVWFILLFATVGMALISSLLLLDRRMPLYYVQVHVGVMVLPIAAALAGLIFADHHAAAGLWRSDILAWFMALFILTLGWMIARFCLRYLHGDRAYRKYFSLLTFTVSAAALTWMNNDIRLLVLFWGLPLLGLVQLTRLKREWRPARTAAVRMAMVFSLSWLALFAAGLWLWSATGHWQLSLALSSESIRHLEWWEKTGVNVLLILAAIIPAGQWPFQRWLLESAVTPTPISAVMHAGLINAGGLLLTRFSPLFSGDISQMLLLVLASISVLIGTGISFVQVDYKRQLVASTMAQMGLMLIQCALGAYVAAVIHLVLHGLFKATLFLQSGSVVPRPNKIFRLSPALSKTWLLTGAIFGFAIGLLFWMTSPEENARLLSALILGWSLAFAWGRLAVFEEGRWIGLAVLAGVALASEAVHGSFMILLHKTVPLSSSSSMITEMTAVFMLVVGGLASIWFSAHRSSDSFARLYMWLVHIGEPRSESAESHPHYLAAYLKKEAQANEYDNRITRTS
ncbi:NADH dehydrogenase subunit 5 [Geobacillus sp. E263]|uniref:NADH dehydrogenase subunit 5 n=1 Tax=Geobacillus sp. E263 TaxID=391290 RepID=UPI00117ADE42|nr:NADH dehydrogenase subunit 5 [Geobacillus sp. E263]